VGWVGDLIAILALVFRDLGLEKNGLLEKGKGSEEKERDHWAFMGFW